MKAVLFDLDGTLIDSSEGITKCAQYALKEFGIDEPDLDKLKAFIGPPLAGSFSKYYGFNKEQANEAVKVYRRRYVPTGIYECTLYPGVEKSLIALREEGFLIGMASSKPEVSCRRILEHFNIIHLFDECVGATEDGRIGSKEEVLNEVMRRWSDISKDDMCLVGDTIYDIEGANLVGMKSIGVSFGFGDAKEMKTAGAICICEDMYSVVEAIRKINRR